MAAILVAIGFVCVGSAPADALDVRVQGRSELDARVVTAGTRIIVRGHLRDDLGKPLPQRTVGATLFEAEDDRRIEGRAVETDRRGEFEVPIDVVPGRYRVALNFESTTHVTGTVFEETVEVERAPVELSVRAPQLVHGQEGAVELRVSASIEGVGMALPVEITLPSGETLERRLDDGGRASVDVSGKLEPGGNRLRVTVPADGPREATTQTVAIRRVETMTVEASVAPVFERLQRGAAVDGAVRSREGPIGGVDVEATLVPVGGEGAERARRDGGEGSGRLVERTESDGQGRFHLFFGRENLPDGEWGATVRLSPEVGPAVERTVGTFTIDRSWSRWVVNGAAGLAVLVLLLVAGREVWVVIRAGLEKRRRRQEESRRRQRAFDEEETLQAIPVASGPEDGEEVDRDRVAGTVWDGWKEQPVGGARVEVWSAEGDTPDAVEQTDAQGRFVFEDLEAGERELVVSATYYVRGRYAFEIPHSGALAGCRFDLVPVPLKIRRLYQSLVELARGEDLWGEMSPREIRGIVVGVLEARPDGPEEGTEGSEAFAARVRDVLAGDEQPETPVELLEALTDIVEETYFGPRRYDEKTWQLARRIALRLREAIEGGGHG